MTWISVGISIAGLAAGAVGSAAAASNAPGFGGAAPVKYNPLDPSALQKTAVASDIRAYGLSDSDLAARFPGLVAGNNQDIDNAYKQLTGPLDSTVQNAFTTNALENSLAISGGGNSMAGVGAGGSFSGNAATSKFANELQTKQDYDRQNFDTVLSQNPQRQFGFPGATENELEIGNASNENAYNVAKYQFQTAKENAGGGGF